MSVSGEVAASRFPRGSFPPIPPQEAEGRQLAFRLFLAPPDLLARADRLCNRREPAVCIRLLTFDDREEFALDFLGDGTAAACADGDPIDRANRRYFRGGALKNTSSAM